MPLLPLAAEIKSRSQKNKVYVLTDNKNHFVDALQSSRDFDDIYRISAGKYRRYPNQSAAESILDIKTHALNVRDAGRTIKGLAESRKLLKRLQPDVIFIKGGYVAVPVGIAAHRLDIPFIVHDSDGVPSLVTRIIGRWAKERLIGIQNPRKESSGTHVGIPVPASLKPVTASLQKKYKQKLGLPVDRPLLLVTGGSQGASAINKIIDTNREFLEEKEIHIVHITGRERKAQTTDFYQSMPFIESFHDYIRAADIVVTRAGSAMAEFAALKKPVIAIPGGHLAGGHQEVNARIVNEAEAAIVLKESELQKNPRRLSQEVIDLLKDKKHAAKIAANLKSVYPAHAVDKIVDKLYHYENKVSK